MVDAPAVPRKRQVPESPISPNEVANVRRPTLQATLLPPRTFHDQEIFDYEQDAWFAGGWVSIGRVEDAQTAGQFFLAQVAGENLIIVRGNVGELRCFFNVCRHRGATILEEVSGTLSPEPEGHGHHSLSPHGIRQNHPQPASGRSPP